MLIIPRLNPMSPFKTHMVDFSNPRKYNLISLSIIPACSGVPQGSILGPILFLLFVNALPDVLLGSGLLFADDVKMISARSQYEELHQNLQAAFQWSEDCDLPLNVVKCSHVAIGGPFLSLGL